MPSATNPSRSPTLPELAGTRVTVMGLGRFGGGLGVTRFLLARGSRVTLTDTADESQLRSALDQLRAHEAQHLASGTLTLRLGAHDHADFADADLIVANPAVGQPWNNPFLRTAETVGVPITTEIELTITCLPAACPVVGVTGSAGKSTTSAMIAHALRATHRRAHLGGNIGGSLLDSFTNPDAPDNSIQPGDPVVLELSSAMLHWLSRSRDATIRAWSPAVAVVTGFAPNHLDWHGSLNHYRVSKQHLIAHHPAAAILAGVARGWPTRPGVDRVEVIETDPRLASLPKLLVPGAHNRMNAAVALAACEALARAFSLHADPAALTEALAAFPGLPHRLCTVAIVDGVRYIDDSKSTTPDSALLALEALATETPLDRVHLIAGGYDKGIDLTPLANHAPELGSFTAIGATAAALCAACPEHIHAADSLAAAVDRARACARAQVRAPETVAPPIVLLSPACASWDQFENYEERGRVFAGAAAGAESNP